MPTNSDTPPASGIFSTPQAQAQASAVPWNPQEQQRIDAWLQAFVASGALSPPGKPTQTWEKPRVVPIRPFLLVRNAVGDNGKRPLAAGTSVDGSPDIWTMPGTPQQNPVAVWSPTNFAYTYQPVTLCAHVWNLGTAPVVGARVEFYEAPFYKGASVSDGLTPPGAVPTRFIGVTRVDLPGRYSRSCHALVTCPVPYQLATGATMTIYVRIRGFMDDAPPNVWDPTLDRHVAHRQIHEP